jgi:hypothetical protein
MDTPLPPVRLDTLARRVRWIDRWRHAMAMLVGLAAWVVLTQSIGTLMNDSWSVLAMSIALLFSTAVWWLTEAAFAYLAALWEVEHDTLLRDRGLPRAQLVVRK